MSLRLDQNAADSLRIRRNWQRIAKGNAAGIYNVIAPITGGSTGIGLALALPLIVSASTLTLPQATSTANGYLKSTDWTTFNNKQPAGSYMAGSTGLSTTAPLAGGGTISTGLTLSLPAASSTVNGYLSSTDWTTFNNKSNTVGTVTSVGLSLPGIFTVSGSPVTTAGTLTGNLATQGSTQVFIGPASGVNAAPTFRILASTDIPTLNESQISGLTTDLAGKVPTSRLVSTTAPLAGGGDLSADRTLSIPVATSTANGYLSSTDWTTFNNAASAGGGYVASTLPPGYRNLLINGDFGIRQRATGVTTLTSTTTQYVLDRWLVSAPANQTITCQNITVSPSSTAPAAHFGITFTQSATASSQATVEQRIEEVWTGTGKSITVSFWASVNTTNGKTLNVDMTQNFGTGGSASVDIAAQSVVLTSTAAQYGLTFAIPDIAGKTVGTVDTTWLRVRFLLPSTAFTNVRLFQVQAEIGTSSTVFDQRPKVDELERCQRYYAKTASYAAFPGTGAGTAVGCLQAAATGTANNALVFSWRYPHAMRVAPTIAIFSAAAVANVCNLTGSSTTVAVSTSQIGDSGCSVVNTAAPVDGSLYQVQLTADAEL